MNEKELIELMEQYEQLKSVLNDEEKKKIRQLLGLEPPDFIEWVESQFYIPETRQPMQLYWLQKAAIREAMKTDDDGKFVYSTIMWGDIKKSAKTCIGAARALWTAVHEDFATVRVIGNDLKQSQSRMFEYIIRCVKLNDEMREKLQIRVVRNKIIIGAKNSYIEAIAVDPEGEAGGGDSMVGFTELWGARTQAHIKMWTELTLSPLKYGRSQRWCESYAGVRGHSPLLEMLYDRCVIESEKDDTNSLGAQRIDVDVLVEHEERDDHGQIIKAPFFTDSTNNIFCMWNRQPHVPWQTKEYYDNERATILDHEFERVHRNTFLESQQRYIDESKLRGCYGEVTKLVDTSILILASDAGYSSDSYGLVGVLYDPRTDIVELAFEQEWTAPEGQEVDLSLPEGVVRRLARKHIVLVWAYDPYQLKRTAQSLRSENQTHPIATYEFIQQSKRSIADKALLDRISTADIILPEDSMTVQHLKNSDMKVIDTGKVRMVKRGGPSGGPIDLAVCLSMATYVAVSERDKFPRPIIFRSDAGGAVRKYLDTYDSGGYTLPDDELSRPLPSEVYDRQFERGILDSDPISRALKDWNDS